MFFVWEPVIFGEIPLWRAPFILLLLIMEEGLLNLHGSKKCMVGVLGRAVPPQTNPQDFLLQQKGSTPKVFLQQKEHNATIYNSPRLSMSPRNIVQGHQSAKVGIPSPLFLLHSLLHLQGLRHASSQPLFLPSMVEEVLYDFLLLWEEKVHHNGCVALLLADMSLGPLPSWHSSSMIKHRILCPAWLQCCWGRRLAWCLLCLGREHLLLLLVLFETLSQWAVFLVSLVLGLATHQEECWAHLG